MRHPSLPARDRTALVLIDLQEADAGMLPRTSEQASLELVSAEAPELRALQRLLEGAA